MNFYRVLRDNKELGPFSLEELKKIGLKSSDLVWVDGQSAAWRFPDDVPGLLVQVSQSVQSTDNDLPVDENLLAAKPKKRYRLTADHRMVEITEEEAKSTDLPRIEEQPPAPKNEILPPANNTQEEVRPFEELPLSRRNATQENDFPLEPELVNKPKRETTVPFQEEPFSKKRTNTPEEEEVSSLPLEPELMSKPKESQPIEEFVDVDPNSNSNDMAGKDSNAPSNTGAFVLAGLLFLVAIGFFGYKWYQDQQEFKLNDGLDHVDKSLATDSTKKEGASGFDNSRSMAMHDDTLGQFQRMKERRAQDSLKRAEAAKAARIATLAKAKEDSLERVLAAQQGLPDTPKATTEKPKADTAKESKVNKIRTTDDIGKYVRVGVVQPKSQTNGVAGVKLVVHNINNRNLAKVHINVQYYDTNGNVIKKSDIIAPNITINNSVTVPVPDNSNAAYVSYKVTGLLGDHVNLQAK